MALSKGKLNELPSDAVVLSEDEAVIYQMKVMKKWKNQWDVFPFKAGPYVLGGASFFTGMFLSAHFRTKFRLYNHGRMSTYLPMCVLPALFSTLIHVQWVLKDVMLQNTGTCPICLEMRASALQTMMGFGFPLILGPLATLSIVHQYGTYDLPYITKEPGKVWAILRKTMKPISNIMVGLVIGHALLASTVTYFESRSVLKVTETLATWQKQIENS